MILTFLLKHHLFKGYYADPELECQAYHVCLQVGNIWFGLFIDLWNDWLNLIIIHCFVKLIFYK